MSRNGSIWYNLDWPTITMFLVLALFGWMNIYGASYNFDQTSIFDFSNRAGKQFVWILTALVMGGIILIIDYKTYDVLAYIFYAIMILLLLATPFLAHNVKGSYSWITMGPVSLQPAEFAKCITALAVAKYMGRYEYKVRDWRDLIVPFALIGVPMLIIMVWQRETGSSLVFASFLLVFYRQGMSGYVLWSGAVVVILFILAIRFGIWPCYVIILGITAYFLWKDRFEMKHQGILYLRRLQFWIVMGFMVTMLFFTHTCDFAFHKILQPHQRSRIEVLLGMKDDPSGVGYNVNQAKIAIGSGRFFGKGFLQGTQTKLNYVPEQATDFIFCTVGEEWGFIGSMSVLLLYMFFILRLITIAERQRDTFSQIYAYIVVGIFFFHLTINVGMVLGLLPVIGIPLPFFSYGGSSLWGFTILLFILLRLDAARVEKLH